MPGRPHPARAMVAGAVLLAWEAGAAYAADGGTGRGTAIRMGEQVAPPRPAAPAPEGAAGPRAPREGREEGARARGFIVVAMGDSQAAARALAAAVYRDAALRPPIDETAAQALVGGDPGPGAPEGVRELASIRRALVSADEDAARRRLLTSLGAETGAEFVASVELTTGHPVARVLRVASGRYEPRELGAKAQSKTDGTTAYEWPEATTTLRGILVAARGDRGDARAPLAPLASGAGAVGAERGVDAKSSSRGGTWSSPWFWGTLGAVAAVGLTVFVLSRTSDDGGNTLHLQGRVAP